MARTAPLCDAIISSSYCALQHNTQYDTHTQYPPRRRGQRGNEMSDVERFGDEVQRAGKNGFNAAVSSFAEANKGLQAIAAEITAYSKSNSCLV